MWMWWILGALGCTDAHVSRVIVDRVEGPVVVVEVRPGETWDVPGAWVRGEVREGEVWEVVVRRGRCGEKQD